MADVDAVREGLEDLRPLLKVIGALGVSASQRAFDDQQFDEEEWLPRYPSQGERGNFVNIAGLVANFNEGGGPLSRFFDERPALLGTGQLRGSITSQVLAPGKGKAPARVEVGSNHPGASIQNFGGESEIPITQTALIKAQKLRASRPIEARKVLDRIVGEPILVTQVVQRKFIGVTPELERDIADEVVAYFEGLE